MGRATSGSFTAILGPSGSGKTTLLDCLALRNTSFSGALKLDDKPPTSSFFSHTGRSLTHPQARPWWWGTWLVVPWLPDGTGAGHWGTTNSLPRD